MFLGQKIFLKVDLFMKLFLRGCFCFLSLMISPFFLRAYNYTETEDGGLAFDIDDPSILDDVNPMASGPDDLLTKFVPSLSPVLLSDKEINFLDILRQELKNPLWKKTPKKKGRDPLDMLTYTLRKFDYRGAQFNIFYNATDKMPITLGDTINLDFMSEGNFNVILDLMQEELGFVFEPSDVTAFFMLLKNIWVEERKFGCLMRFNPFKGPFTLKFELPVLLSERNIMATIQDQNEINNLLDRYFSEGSGFDKNREFARILIGLGDTRLKLGMDVIDHVDFKTNVGFSSIFPTAGGILLDGRFEKPRELQAASDLVNDLISNIRKEALRPELGNNGHFGFGTYLESKLNLFRDKIWFWWRLSYEELLSSREKRLIMHKKTIENPDSFFNVVSVSDLERSEKLNQFRLEYVAPELYNVTVRPGGVLTFDFMGNLNWKHFLFGLGYNFYLKRREIFTKLHSIEVNMNSLRVEDATVTRALQHKIVGEISYRFKFDRAKFTLCLGGDKTFSSWHLGKDWTIYSRIGLKF